MRLAAVLRGQAASVVLESYDAERGGEHRQAQRATGKGHSAGPSIGARHGRGPRAGGQGGAGIGALLQGTDDLQQLSVSYPKSPLNEDHLSGVTHLLQRGPGAGERAPEAEVTVDGRTTSLFPFITTGRRDDGWALLCFDGRSTEAGPSLRAAIEAVAPWDWVRPRLVLAGPVSEAGRVPVLSDLDGKAHGAYAWKANPPSFSSVRMGISPNAARPTAPNA